MQVDSEQKLLELYKITVDEQKHLEVLNQKVVGLFTGLFTAIVGALLFVLFRAEGLEEADKLKAVMVAAGVVTLLALLAYVGMRARSERGLRIISIRAKIENDLGLMRAGSRRTAGLWKGEPMVFPWDCCARRLGARTSADFVASAMRRPRGWSLLLFGLLVLLGCAGFMFHLVAETWNYLEKTEVLSWYYPLLVGALIIMLGILGRCLYVRRGPQRFPTPWWASGEPPASSASSPAPPGSGPPSSS